MEHKIFPTASTKVIDEVKGIVEHVITVFGVLDLVEDISHPGSWTKTLAERGDKLLVLDMHNTDSINRAIGTPISVREVGRNELPQEILAKYPEATGGVVAQTQMLMDTPEGKGAFIRLRDKAVREWSYGYDALDVDRSVVKNKDGDDVSVRNLRTVKVYEYGPVLFGAVPGTMVTGVKEKPDDEEQEPTETKPAPEVTENTIRIRVRAPGDFQEDSFRTITIGDEDDGIQAVIGRLEDETTTTTQSFIFDKEKFTTAEAQAWVDEHEKQAVPVEAEKAEPEAVPDKETGTDEEEKGATGTAKAVDLTQYVADVRTAFEGQYNPPNDMWRYWVMAVYDEYVIVQNNNATDGVEFYQVGYVKTEDDITFTPQGEWIGGEYVFVPHDVSPESELARDAEGDETKAGRVLAGRNETRIVSALLTLIDVLDDAGIELPGFEKNPVIVVPEEETSAPVKQAANDDKEAGPIVDDESPTLRELVLKLEIENLADWLKEQAESLAKLNKEVTK
jgi:hypothetical protein